MDYFIRQLWLVGIITEFSTDITMWVGFNHAAVLEVPLYGPPDSVVPDPELPRDRWRGHEDPPAAT
jgi:hypothetical protein